MSDFPYPILSNDEVLDALYALLQGVPLQSNGEVSNRFATNEAFQRLLYLVTNSADDAVLNTNLVVGATGVSNGAPTEYYATNHVKASTSVADNGKFTQWGINLLGFTATELASRACLLNPSGTYTLETALTVGLLPSTLTLGLTLFLNGSGIANVLTIAPNSPTGTYTQTTTGLVLPADAEVGFRVDVSGTGTTFTHYLATKFHQ